jgi:hypothetical protein
VSGFLLEINTFLMVFAGARVLNMPIDYKANAVPIE